LIDRDDLGVCDIFSALLAALDTEDGSFFRRYFI